MTLCKVVFGKDIVLKTKHIIWGDNNMKSTIAQTVIRKKKG